MLPSWFNIYTPGAVKNKTRILIDLELIKKSDIVQHDDAKIFRQLSGLEQRNDKLKVYPNSLTVEQSFQTMFDNFNIRRNDWINFMILLTSPNHLLRSNIPDLIKMCTSIGIFNIGQVVDEEMDRRRWYADNYNPMKPCEDYKHWYSWRVGTAAMNHLSIEGKDYETTTKIDNGPFFFFRKKKDIQPFIK